MTKSQSNASVGDTRSPPLQPEARGLRTASEEAILIGAESSAPALKTNVLASVTAAVKAMSLSDRQSPCKQSLWFSFFFDGTGNNLYADEGLAKHSNVARLFRVHMENNSVTGIYAFYIPGVGTYFPEIGDDGGSKLGLGTGSMGEERLNYALTKFDTYLVSHLGRARSAASAAIIDINIAMFGFSRGAALARAFLNMLIEKRCIKKDGRWVLKDGSWPMRFRFMGLFDTVASVGLPMSSNTTSGAAATFSRVNLMINYRLQTYDETRPESLAFCEEGKAGADPAPGTYDGHAGWGGRLAIDQAVEEVRHFIAAHEIRNSFPVDSISTWHPLGPTKPAHFYEAVYPGVHSDIGGSYAPGEGARSGLRPENLGLVPLIHMYNYAVARGVPLLSVKAAPKGVEADFNISKGLIESYNYYLRKVGSCSILGQLINKHMSLYYAWRFRTIRIKAAGNHDEAKRISAQSEVFKKEEQRIDAEITGLEDREKNATVELNTLVSRREAQTGYAYPKPAGRDVSTVLNEQIQAAQRKKQAARDEVLKAKARKLANPEMDQLQEMLNLYDAQLLKDVRAIKKAFSLPTIFGIELSAVSRRELRPHYRALVEAYENEFEKNKGLTDPAIISFFDNYIHDSLAGFAGDATLPSDPRVVYVGGDEKLKFAKLENDISLGSDSPGLPKAVA